MAKAEVSMVDVMKNVTMIVTLTGEKSIRVRMWVGCRLIKAAAWVMNCGVEFKNG